MKVKEYPWKCHHCREKAVFPATLDYVTTIEHDGRAYEVRVPGLEVPQCRNCGRLVMVDSASRRISDALRQAAGLLTPDEIREKRKRLRLTQEQLAHYLRVAKETVSRWETGGQIQQRAMNDFLQAFFDLPALRQYLERRRGEGEEAVVSAEPGVIQPEPVFGRDILRHPAWPSTTEPDVAVTSVGTQIFPVAVLPATSAAQEG